MVDSKSFERLIDGKHVGLYTIRKGDVCAQITNYGAKIVSLTVPNNKGVVRDVVLGFNTLDEWLEKETYFNAIIGRYANRIKDGRFCLEGKQYQLAVNNGTNHLHGGQHGFNEKVWQVMQSEQDSISLQYVAEDGEENYPGRLTLAVTYSIEEHEGMTGLMIHYNATTDSATICGFTNHAYFNLKGEGEGDIHDHELLINADYFTPTDDTFAPTGAILSVEGTALDFRTAATIGSHINDPIYAAARGLDHNWVVRHKEAGDMAHAATLAADGLKMHVYTTLPGLQVYTGNYVEQNTGKAGKQYDVRSAVCLEAQGFPNSPNIAHFPSAVLHKADRYDHKCLYLFEW